MCARPFAPLSRFWPGKTWVRALFSGLMTFSVPTWEWTSGTWCSFPSSCIILIPRAIGSCWKRWRGPCGLEDSSPSWKLSVPTRPMLPGRRAPCWTCSSPPPVCPAPGRKRNSPVGNKKRPSCRTSPSVCEPYRGAAFRQRLKGDLPTAIHYNNLTMPALLERGTVVCFLASYTVAFALEVGHLLRPRPIVRLLGLAFVGAGLLAHTIFVFAASGNDLGRRPLASPFSALLLLAWILAVFYLYGSIHHGRLAWGLFVLPLVLGLIGLAESAPPGPESSPGGG